QAALREQRRPAQWAAGDRRLALGVRRLGAVRIACYARIFALRPAILALRGAWAETCRKIRALFFPSRIRFWLRLGVRLVDRALAQVCAKVRHRSPRLPRPAQPAVRERIVDRAWHDPA